MALASSAAAPLVRQALVALLVALALALQGCNDDGPGSSSNGGGVVNTRVAVSALPGAGRSRSLLRRLQGGLAPQSAVQSSTSCAYAQVDSLQLNVYAVRFASLAGRGRDLVSTRWGPNFPLTLLPGQNTVPLNAPVALPPGPYIAADFVFWNRWAIQAFCRTQTMFVYTTANGARAVPLTNTMPSDYAPMFFDLMPPGLTFTAETSDMQYNTYLQRQMTFLNSVYNYTVGQENTTVNLLLDTSYSVGCYDGTRNFSSAGMELLPLFNNNINNWSQPAIAFWSWQLPVFVSATADGATAVGETYVFGLTASALPVQGGPPVDWSTLLIITATWSSGPRDGAILLDMRPRGNAMLFTNMAFNMGLFNFAKDASTGSWSFQAGPQWWWSYFYQSARRLSNFTRMAAGDFTTVGTVTMQDGPDCAISWCGEAASPDCRGQPVGCLNAARTLRYVQVPRLS